MSKWYDANGTDIDAYPDKAFQGGVYAPQRRQPMRQYSAAEIEEVNQRGRERVSRRENDEHRALENSHRAIRLRQEEAIRRGLVSLWADANAWAKDEADEPTRLRVLNSYTRGRTGLEHHELEALIKTYDYLRNVPNAAFRVQ